MDADDVATYLRGNPGFFEQHTQLLADITVPHPHDGRAISLSDRQMLQLRERNKVLESRLGELIQIGEENDAIGARMHRLSLGLTSARDLATLDAALHNHLQQDFAVPHVALRLWGGFSQRGGDALGGAAGEAGGAVVECLRPVGDAVREYAAALAQPFCGPSGQPEVASWFGPAASHVRSVAFMALRDLRGSDPGSAPDPAAPCAGMLALGSEDVLRFYPDMGTLFLERIGELVSASLVRIAP